MRTRLQILRRIKSSSYYKPLRNRHLGALELNLNDSEFRLYDFLQAICNWKKDESLSFGLVEFTERDLAPYLRWSASKLNKVKNSLIKNRLLVPVDTHTYRVEDLKHSQNFVENLEQEYSRMQQNYSTSKQNASYMKQNSAQNYDSPSISYTDNNSINRDNNISRTDEDYKKIQEELGNGLSIEDMKSIDNST